MKPMKLNQSRNKQNSKINIISVGFAALFFILFSFGCNSNSETIKLKAKINNLNTENAELAKQIEQAKAENEQLKSQIAALQNLPENAKGENLYKLENVKIHNYSTLYDENKDDKIDTMIVRIQPIDNFGDIIKAAGSVEVTLWNLNKPEGQAQIGTWKVNSEELKKTWNSTLVQNYRLSFDVSESIEKFDEPLTLKVTFIDHLTGKVFKEQKVLKP